MKKMNNELSEALAKLSELNGVKGQKEKAMAPLVAQQLKSFCRQEAEFAQAIVQGGSFAECMATVAKGVGQSISDLEAYRKAVAFYFPGAQIRMQMTIDLVGDAALPDPAEEAGAAPALSVYKPEKAEPTGLVLSLEDFL